MWLWIKKLIEHWECRWPFCVWFIVLTIMSVL